MFEKRSAGMKLDSIVRRVLIWCIQYSELLLFSAVGVFIGLVVGLAEVLFGYGLGLIQQWRQGWGCWPLLALPAAGLVLTWAFSRFGKTARRGMNLVFEVSQGKSRWIPKRTVTMMTLGTWLSHLVGASTGKEGVAMQIGATISHVVGRRLTDRPHSRTIFLVTGMAAGFAGLFGTPFTAVFFALEVLVAGTLKYRALAPALCASFTASWVSSRLGVHASTFTLDGLMMPVLNSQLWKLIFLGVLFGIAGGLFAWCSRKLHSYLPKKMPDLYRRVFYLSVLLAALLYLLHHGRYSGSGENLIRLSLNGGVIYSYDWLLKGLLTILTLSLGFVGGEVTPLFAMGASLGAALAPVFGLDPMICAALGYASVFGAGTNTWLAAIMIGIEIFGFAWFPYFFLVCSVAYLVNRNQSIYTLQQRYGQNDA